MSRRRLIVNADDFGFARRITDAIVDSHTKGWVTSTTLMANMPAAEYAAERARELPGLGIGVHLNLSQGRPVLPPDQVPDLVTAEGKFHPQIEMQRRLWRDGEIYHQVCAEYAAQVQKTIDLGILPTHFDSHHGIHKMPVAMRALIDVAHRFGVGAARTQVGFYWCGPGATASDRVRVLAANGRIASRIVWHRWNHWRLRRAGIRTADWKATRTRIVPCPREPIDQVLACLAALPEGVSEMVLHPGYETDEVRISRHFEGVWEVDTRLAFDSRVPEEIRRQGIELVSYADI